MDASERSKDLAQLLESNGLRGKKLTKAIDNFSYNLALLHGQTDLLNKARQDAHVVIRQVTICMREIDKVISGVVFLYALDSRSS